MYYDESHIKNTAIKKGSEEIIINPKERVKLPEI
jgi:hypothetical protein